MAQDPFDSETTEHRDLFFEEEGIFLQRLPTVTWDGGSLSIGAATTLGSSSNAAIRLADPAVSRLHAELDVRDDGLWVNDLGSKNGTFVQGIKVQAARVPDGGRIRIGESEIAVEYAKVPTPVELWPESSFGPLLGKSRAMRRLFHQISRFAPLDSPVVIQGETGTGKELVARAIHDASPRAAHPFTIVDCAALAGNLLEAELFGHRKGAFTGATDDRIGQVQHAEGGTIFLDEIGELPASLQPKLLRLLESRSYRPLGTNEYLPANVRFLAATHRNLGEMVNRETFREDLFFRLNVLTVEVPPLDARREDIPLLVDEFAKEADPQTVTDVFLQQLQARSWPGNVRELRNVVHRVAALGPALALTMQDPFHAAEDLEPVRLDDTYANAREQAIASFERRYVAGVIHACDGNVSQAARMAGVNRTYLHQLMRKHGLR